MGLFRRSTEEDKIRAKFLRNAIDLAEQAYQKDLSFRKFQSTDLNHAIMQDLMKAAQFTGKVTVKFHALDGSITAEAVIESLDQRQQLNRLDENKFYDNLPQAPFSQAQR